MTRHRRKPAKLITPDFDLGVRGTFAVSAKNLSGAVGGPLEIKAAPGASKSPISLEARVARTKQDAHGLKRVPGARSGLDVITQPVPGDKNGLKRTYKLHSLERMQAAGILSKPQLTAGLRIVDAWEGTQKGRSSDLSAVRVDTTARPDQQTMITLEASHRYAAAMKPVPRASRAIVEWVCLEGNSVGSFSTSGSHRVKALGQLRAALDMVANSYGQ